MKTLAVTIALMATLFSSAAFAQDQLASAKETTKTIPADAVITPNAAYFSSFQAVVFPRKNGNVAVHVEKSPLEDVKINVYNSRGQLVNEDKLSKHHLYKKQYQMQSLPKGTYTFEIISKSKMYKKEIQLN